MPGRPQYYGYSIDHAIVILEASPMELVTVSPKFQIVIPKQIRELLKLEPGMKLCPLIWEDGIVYVRPRSLKEVQAMFRGQPNDFERDETDRDL
jgi:AbrB family looped-hinge helix DNA binding protein